LFWIPCATHCVDVTLEDMGKNPYIEDIIELIRSITKFIYNYAYVLSFKRRFTNKKELVHPTITSFASRFISLSLSWIVCDK